MADGIPHDGASPEMEVDPELEPLQLSVRPFDPTTYDPEIYVLPPDSIRQFRGFVRGAAEDFLLCKADSHLSYGTSDGDSHAIRGYRTTSAREWHMELPDDVRYIIDEAGFGLFCMGLSRLIVSRPLLGALVERWWDTTDSFHFSTAGEMTMTPFDFSMVTGIEVGGHPIPYDTDMGEWEAAWIYLLGARPPISRSGMVQYTWFADHYRGTAPVTREETEQYARGFLMFLFGTTLFANQANTVELYLVSALVGLSCVRLYDWGGTGLATLYEYMSLTSCRSGHLIGGYWRAWELWMYAYFLTLALEPEVEMPHVVPYSHRYDGRCQLRSRESFLFFCRYFDT
ncbi:Protein MAIN-LIKE 2, partial [Camellia lanceoleosa]